MFVKPVLVYKSFLGKISLCNCVARRKNRKFFLGQLVLRVDFMDVKQNRRQLRVCVVGSSKRFFSGITTHTIFLANALSDTNEVSVILFRKLLPEFLFPGRNRVGKHESEIDFLPEIDVFDGMDYHSPITWYGAYKFLNKHKPDVIIILWWSSSVAHLQLLLKAINKVKIRAKIILEMHEVIDPLEAEIFPLKLYSLLVGRMLINNLDAYSSQSHSDKDLIASTYGISGGKIYVIPVGLYEDYSKPMDQDIAKKRLGINEKLVILNFGLIREYKGVQYLVEAFNRLPQEIAMQSKLLIVGEVWNSQLNLKEKVDRSIYKSQIYFVPRYVSDNEIPLYFSAADVIVLPYLRASGSGIAHIAMTYGKPIIVSDVGGLRESMKDYEGTIFVPPKESDKIKEEIIKVFNTERIATFKPPKRSWHEIANMYNEVIEEL